MRPNEHVPTEDTRRVVYHLTIAGCSQDTAAKAIGITKKTLRRHYMDVIDSTAGKCLETTVAALMTAAERGNMEAIKLLLRRYDEGRLWKDAPQEITVTHRLQSLSDDELNAEIERLRTIEGEAETIDHTMIEGPSDEEG